MSRDADTLNAQCSLGSWSPRARFFEHSGPKERRRHGLWKGVANRLKGNLLVLGI